ncbi:pyruvate dehydrogenase (acetyl-transferring) E1 component subunit alpha [Hymenobacter lutimineralis]|uniref:Pyruvate dehydrogenase E1 component subunit alpha n=1 Tax=Hymenobacter lutimineralis TaxID=2606448 RepID=A0A5D6V627_9BACT|nr:MULTISPECIES: pyruvate dehydrogenase (acetyl-transferring) E1 component subunit alpha [Hymenobacter]QIX61530.1 pyruvate dehydrogenase (acetyl-transferring) E1 component subunit alpha [Hymenobacter sp. BT18]TYZ11461.1 pyruvate dehydrogenase (acetyl-transferring) E1 component subunit alpha [Hymenobacter lutimineralis]
MAETKVKGAQKASNSTKKTSAPKAAAKGTATETVKQPDPVLPIANGEAAAATGAPKATTPAQPEFPKETYLRWYEQMQLMRKFEEKAGQLYGQQKIKGFCHLYIGQEACVAGAVSALTKDDKWITAYRDHAHPLALGTSPNAIMAELYAKATGCSKGKGGSMHMFDKEVNFIGGHGIVGAQVPMGAGIAFAEKYNKTGNLCICYMGDGAVRQGALHEAFNMAMLWKLPVIFVVENNGYAMGTSVQRTSNVTELYTMGESYDMPAEPVNAMSVEDVHNAVARAAERARAGEGPTFLEFKTYRYKGHSMSDPAKYRTKEELEDYRSRDAIEAVRHTILTHNMASEEDLAAIDEKIKAQVLESVEFAENSPFPTADELYKDVYVQQDYPYIHD